MKKKLIDKFLLILIGVAGISIVFFLGEIIAGKWIAFIFASIGYLIILLFLTFTFEDFKKIPKYKQLLFQCVFYILTVGITCISFKYELLPMPKSFHVYTIGIVILAISSVVLLGYLVKRMKFFRANNNRNTARKSGVRLV